MKNLNINNESQNNLCDERVQAQVTAELARYHMLLARGRASARATFSENELWLMADALNGTVQLAEFIEYLWHEVSDACHLDDLDRKWEVDGKELVRKLREAETSTIFALADAIEQFWLREDRRSVLDTFDELDLGKPRLCAYHSFERPSAEYEIATR